MDEGSRKLRWIGSIKEICFRRRRKETILPFELTLTGSEFHRVGAATEKAWVLSMHLLIKWRVPASLPRTGKAVVCNGKSAV